MGTPEVLPFAGGLGAILSWGRGGMVLEVMRMVRRGRCYAVNSRHSIDFKTQFVAHTPFCQNLLYQQMILLGLEITNLLVVGRRRRHFFPTNEFSGNGNAGGAANCWWFGCNVKLGMGGNGFGGNKDGQKRMVLRCQFKAFN